MSLSSKKKKVNSAQRPGQVSSETPERISWGSQVATVSGLDRLKVGLYVRFKNLSFLDLLGEAKLAARDKNEPVPIKLKGDDQEYICHPTGRKGGFAFHISRGDVHIFASTRKDIKTPNVWVDIGSESCWSPSYKNVINQVTKLLSNYDGHIFKNTISEVHLCTDVIGQDIEELPIDNARYWISRATKFASYFDRENLQGIKLDQVNGDLQPDNKKEFPVSEGCQVGKGDIQLRIYNKVLELKHNKSKQYLFSSLWNESEFDNKDVTRVEFQLRRQVLKQMNINSLDDLDREMAGIWRYCTTEWARLSFFDIDRKNRHQDRAKTHPFWEFVQNVDWSVPPCDVVRTHKRANKDWEYLSDMAAGYAMSIGVIVGRRPDDLQGVIAHAQGALAISLEKLWLRKEDSSDKFNEFQKRMKRRWHDIWPSGYNYSEVTPSGWLTAT